MKRTLEKLSRQRQEKETDFVKTLDALIEKSKTLDHNLSILISRKSLSDLEDTGSQEDFNREIVSAIREFRSGFEQNLIQIKELFVSLFKLLNLNFER